LAVRYTIQNSRPSWNVKVRGQRSRSPETKNALSAADTPGCVRMVCARCKQRVAAADGPIGCQLVLRSYVVRQFYVDGKINACCLVCLSVCLSVCLFVCSHDNFRTIQRRMMKLDGWVHCTEISPEFQCHNQRSKVKVTGDKQTKKCGILFWSRPLVLRQIYAGGKISACCLVGAFVVSGLVFPYN